MKTILVTILLLIGLSIQAQTGSIYHDIGYAMPIPEKTTYNHPVWLGPTLIVVGIGASAIGWWLLVQGFNETYFNQAKILGGLGLAGGGAALAAIGTVITRKVLDHRKREKNEYNRIY